MREELFIYVEIYVLGINFIVISFMMKVYVNKGVIGENVIVVLVKKVNIIVVFIFVIIFNFMMGEVICNISEVIVDSEVFKIFLFIMLENVELVGLEGKLLVLFVKDFVNFIKKEFNIK